MKKFFKPLQSGADSENEVVRNLTSTTSGSGGETLILRVSRDHIYWAARTGLQKPMQLSLQRATGTLWQLFADGLALEVMPPYRVCQLPEVADLNCSEWEKLLNDNQVEYSVKLMPTEEHDGYSLLQRRAIIEEILEAKK